jgi:hypothetical protein
MPFKTSLGLFLYSVFASVMLFISGIWSIPVVSQFDPMLQNLVYFIPRVFIIFASACIYFAFWPIEKD